MRLYVHFPFCLAKCPYCDFYSVVADEMLRESYSCMLVAEMEMVRRGRPATDDVVKSVYFGGGTPSLYTPRELGTLLGRLKGLWEVAPRAEVTVEINPATWSGGHLREAASLGINRFSIGAQSFDGRLLSSLGRRHGADDARSLARSASEIEGSSMSLDLIYGVPGQTPGDWRRTLEEALELKPQHVSAYALNVDPSTPMGELVEKDELSLPEEGATVDMYETACGVLSKAGYRHYEISNFAVPGWECSHNLACWKREEYLGFGASAHSFLSPDIRPYNVRDVNEYIKRVSEGISPVEEAERLSGEEAWEEEVMLSLRTSDGIDQDVLERSSCGGGGAGEAWEAWCSAGLAWRQGGRCGLTERGMFVSNHIISRLFAG